MTVWLGQRDSANARQQPEADRRPGASGGESFGQPGCLPKSDRPKPPAAPRPLVVSGRPARIAAAVEAQTEEVPGHPEASVVAEPVAVAKLVAAGVPTLPPGRGVVEVVEAAAEIEELADGVGASAALACGGTRESSLVVV